jgi:hypothetical protein
MITELFPVSEVCLGAPSRGTGETISVGNDESTIFDRGEVRTLAANSLTHRGKGVGEVVFPLCRQRVGVIAVGKRQSEPSC